MGGAAQTDIIRKLGGGVRLALAQYRELAAFAQFASDLDEATRRQLERGQRIMEVLKQPQYTPLSVAHQAVTLYAVDRGYMDDVELERGSDFTGALMSYMDSSRSSLLDQVNAAPKWDDGVEKQFKDAVEDFKANHAW